VSRTCTFTLAAARRLPAGRLERLAGRLPAGGPRLRASQGFGEHLDELRRQRIRRHALVLAAELLPPQERRAIGAEPADHPLGGVPVASHDRRDLVQAYLAMAAHDQEQDLGQAGGGERRLGDPVPAGVAVCGACLAAPPDFDAAFARVDYGFPWDRLIAAFKFHGALDLAPVLAAAIVEARRGAAKPELPWLIVPVPLSEARLRERGYNQAWELARRVARRIDGRADARLVLRIRDTPHQLALPPDARAGNVRGAFAVEPRRIAELRGRAVAVVDDVMTTGSTVAEIARVLKQPGATRVEVWVVARTPRPEDE